jgi:hypothetical protein
MRVGPIAHGALLVAALGFAYQTWTRDKSEAPKVGTVTVWEESLDDFVSFAFDGEEKSVRVERREDGSDAYYWGKVTRTQKKPKPRVPVKAPSEGEEGGDAHGGHGAHGATPPTQGLPSRMGGPGGKATPGKATPGKATPGKTGDRPPASGAKKAEPAKASGAGAGSSTKPPTQSLSPHHAGTDQPEQPAAGTPAKPAKPAAAPAAKPAKPAAPAAKPGDKPAGDKAADKPAGDAPAASESPAEGEDAEADAAGDSAEPASGPEETTSTTKEFPIGRGGEDLITNLAHLHALRDLGVLTDQQKDDYDLTDSKENLTVFFKGEKKHSLIIGARVFGAGDRYVMNADSGRGYVISNSEIMRHIDGAENSLGLKVLHRFQESAQDEQDRPHDPKAPKPKRDKYPGVGQIDIETPDGSRSMVRHEQQDPQGGGTMIGWADKEKPGEQDMTFANFLTQIDRLKPMEYDPSIDEAGLTKVMSLVYKKANGDGLGTFELLKKEPTVTPELEPSEESKKGNEAEYYVKTELTRIPAKVGRMSAERVSDDLPTLFGAPPKKKDPRPTLKEPGVVPGEEVKGGAGQDKAAPADKPAPDKAGEAKPAPAKAGKSAADNPAKAAPDKSVPAKPGAGAPASNPSGSKPNPTEGNK